MRGWRQSQDVKRQEGQDLQMLKGTAYLAGGTANANARGWSTVFQERKDQCALSREGDDSLRVNYMSEEFERMY